MGDGGGTSFPGSGIFVLSPQPWGLFKQTWVPSGAASKAHLLPTARQVVFSGVGKAGDSCRDTGGQAAAQGFLWGEKDLFS